MSLAGVNTVGKALVVQMQPLSKLREANTNLGQTSDTEDSGNRRFGLSRQIHSYIMQNAVSTTAVTQRRTGCKMAVNVEYARTWKEAIVAYFTGLPAIHPLDRLWETKRHFICNSR
jgi:hypothetical protein